MRARLTVGPPAVVATAVVAELFRLYRLADESLSLDEAYSVGIVQRHSVQWLLFEHPTSDPHPPLHYVLLKPWVAFLGPSEMAVRLYAVLFGVATVSVTYYLGQELFDRRVGTVAALLTAVAPLHIWHAQNARMYTLLAFLTALSSLWLVRLARTFETRRAVVYVLATTGLVYTHVFGLFVVLAQVTFLVTRPLLPGDDLSIDARRWLPVQGVVAVLASPWLVVLGGRALESSGDPSANLSWIPAPRPSILRETYVLFVSAKHLDWHLDPAVPTGLPVLLGVVAAGCVLLAMVRPLGTLAAGDDATTTRADEAGGSSDVVSLPSVWLLFLLATVPVLAPYLVSTVVTPILVLRYTIPATVGFYLLVARGVSVVRPPRVGYLVVGLLVLGMLAPLPTYYAHDQKAQWQEAANFVEAGTDGDDLVVLVPGYVWWPFDYYFDGGATVETATASTTSGELEAMVRGHDRVFLVFRYPGEETRLRFRAVVRESGGGREPTERSYVAVSVVRYDRIDAPSMATRPPETVSAVRDTRHS